MEFEVALLEFAQYMVDKDYDNAVLKAQEVSELIDDTKEDTVRDTLNGILDNNSDIPSEKIDEIVDAFGMETVEVFKAIIHFQQYCVDGLTAEEFKTSKAYELLSTDTAEYYSEAEMVQFLRLLATCAIVTRDRELITFMLEKIQELES